MWKTYWQPSAPIEELRGAISDRLSSERINRWIELEGKDARLRAKLFELGVVSEERIAEDGSWMLHVDIPKETAERLARQPGQEGKVAKVQLLEKERSGSSEVNQAERLSTC
jgi:hypothetical protein